MNVFINIFFIFIYIFTILFFKMPDVNDTNYLAHKVILFCLVFVYQVLLILLAKIKSKCKIEAVDIVYTGIETATIAVIGYSLFIDLQQYNLPVLDNIYLTNHTTHLYIAFIITLLLSFVNSMKLLFGFDPYGCIKY